MWDVCIKHDTFLKNTAFENLCCYTSQLKHVFRLEESVTFCGSTLTNSLRQTIITNSLGKQQLEIYTRTYSGRAPWHLVKFLSQLPLSEQFFASFFLFWVGRYIAKHLWLVQLETVNVVSPRPQCFPWRTKGLGETKLTISFVASAYCFQKSYGLRWHQNS